jgi:S1-C subfamily serine protease
VIVVLAGLPGARPSADDLASVAEEVRRTLPREALERLETSPPLVFRGVPPRGAVIYRERVNGVVLIASTNAVGTGVLVSADGDIVTNDHVVRAAHRSRGGEWVAVWFKPPRDVRPVISKFLLARVVQRSELRDLAHIRLAQLAPDVATVVPIAARIPEVGQPVFAIGHPRIHLWSFMQGVVSQVRADYQWRYDDGIPRSATTIQLQAPVNPGSSGGPLLDDAGAVVGIVIGSADASAGIHFAVAVQHVHELLTPRPDSARAPR